MNARNRVFLILGLLTIGSLIWYFVTVRPSGDLQLIGTVDANEVMVAAKIPGSHSRRKKWQRDSACKFSLTGNLHKTG